jgi:hypothetical protein
MNKQLFLIVLLSAFFVHANHVVCEEIVAAPNVAVSRLNDGIIKQYAYLISKEFQYKKIGRMGIKGAAGACVIYALWRYTKPWLSQFKKNENHVQSGALFPSNQELDGRLKLVEGAVLANRGTWWQWFKNNGVQIVNTLVAGSIASWGSSAVGYFDRTFFHEDSLEWFVQQRTNLFDLCPIQLDPRILSYSSPFELQMRLNTLKENAHFKKSFFEEMREHLTGLEILSTASNNQKSALRYLVTSTMANLMTDICRILGFMTFKKERVSPSVSDEISFSIAYITNTANTFCDTIFALIDNESISGIKKRQDAISALNSLKGELSRIVKRCIAIEREYCV